MTRYKKPLDDEILMQKLKDILLNEDRKKLKELQEIINDPEALSDRISPIIEERLDFFRQNFPREYRALLHQIVQEQMKSAQDDILNVMYPVMGTMVRKYITHQFQLLKDRIDNTVRSTFSLKTVARKMRATFLGINESDLLLTYADGPIIEELYVIQRNSGLLLGSASLNNTIDRDVIAGMLTAIKSFVEDAFQREKEDLEMIHYGSYKIFIQNFHSYYFAVAMSGSLSASEKDTLSASLLKFASEELTQLGTINSHTIDTISEKIDQHFIKPQQKKQN